MTHHRKIAYAVVLVTPYQTNSAMEALKVLYYGVFASFCGGWVPVRSLNVKLIVFHLYVFLSFLILPLLIRLVNSSHPVGWIVYSVFVGVSFVFLKVLNYRLHQALGTDPISQDDDDNDQIQEQNNEDNSSVQGHPPPTTADGSHESAASLNEALPTDAPTDVDPSMELAPLSPDSKEDETVQEVRVSLEDSINSPVHQVNDEDDIAVERVFSSSTRERRCQRMSRNDSSNSRHEATTTIEFETSLVDEVKEQLIKQNHQILASVVDKMDKRVLEAINKGIVSDENYSSLEGRVDELSRCVLSSYTDDESPGIVHWFEENGFWDFYSFGERLLPINNDEDFIRRQIDEDSHYSSIVPDFSYDQSATRSGDEPVAPPTDNEPVNRILLVPYVKWSSCELKFSRTQLEDYMDRNVTIPEVVFTIILSVLVCVVASLLFTMTNFFNDFWIFWLSFVISTCHFSLVKSVQSDPSSPTPGQNRINAVSRALYFIFVGGLALILNTSISSDLTSLCVFGFDVNNQHALMFVRDGLFIFLLFFPLLFTLGWMSQFDTFVINVFEQIDMNVFGGTASTGLLCGFYAISRSVLSSLILVPLGYAGFYYLEKDDVTVDSCSFTDFNANQCTPHGRIGLSFLIGGVVSLSYLLSRATSNYQYLYDFFVFVWNKLKTTNVPHHEDPLDTIYRSTLTNRLKVDLFVVVCVFILVTVLNISSIFCHTEILYYVLGAITFVIGVINHYLLPHVRKENPCLCFTNPLVKSKEYDLFEVSVAPKVSYVEMILQFLQCLEKNVLYPLIFIVGINLSAVYYKAKFGNLGAAIVVSVVGMKIFRSAFSDISRQHVILLLSHLFFNYDYSHISEGLPLNYFIAGILFSKIYDLYLKTYFMFVYILPSSWSHPFHIMIQPLLIPHCPVIFFQAIVGSIVGAPMNPVIASPMFFLSYARPVKFWEKNYNTKRQDTSNTRLDQTLDGNMKNPNPDHLDSLFYEQLAWSLQRDICGDMTLGRWGRVTSGDIFILTNDQLNALVHIIEIGNGFVTFQLRGLEFRGTYCHQREREAITEPLTSNDDTCHLPFLLPCKKLCIARWMAWEVISSSYTLHGYSISENQAHLVFNAYVYKKSFITHNIKCIIHYLIKSPHLKTMLNNDSLKVLLVSLASTDAVDVDPLFNELYNIDWDSNERGVGRRCFVTSFYDLISVCCQKANIKSSEFDISEESFLVTLCFAFSLLGRRMFFTHANTGASSRGDNFMHGLYRIFIGDARPSAEKDEWIFHSIESIQDIVIPAARIALKVHQDNFQMSDQHESPLGVYEAMVDAETNHVITHENDKAWRDGVVLNRKSLLALRYQRVEDNYMNPYKIIRLNSKFVKFRLIKLNRECVRGLWSSQQHELIFLRNNDSERGSIQNHKASLRNMINSSMDLPIGYPIYVSPLQTSFLDQHISFNKTVVGQLINPLEYTRVIDKASELCCLPSKAHPQASKVSPSHEDDVSSPDSLVAPTHDYIDPFGDDSSDEDDFWNPIWVGKLVTIIDVNEVFETFNENWLSWPDKSLLRKATISHWKHWRPVEGVTSGEVIHEWRPFHITSTSRSHIDKIIVLIKVCDSDHLVIVKEQGIATMD